MQFVDDELVAPHEMEVIALPVKGRVVDNGVADRAGYLAGIRVDALELALRRGQQVAVLISDMSLGNVGVPVAVLLRLHGMPVAVPVVERSDDGNPLGIRRPHAEPNSPRMRNGSHALDFRFTAHAVPVSGTDPVPHDQLAKTIVGSAIDADIACRLKAK